MIKLAFWNGGGYRGERPVTKLNFVCKSGSVLQYNDARRQRG